MTHRLLSRLFGESEEINGRERCETYLYRWVLSSNRWFKAYLHHFVGDDWSRDLHDHPKRFISIGLRGSYYEHTPTGPNAGACPCGCGAQHTQARLYRAPWIRSFPATHIHRLTVPSKNCWTIVIVLKTVREWGFWHGGRFIPWRNYVDGADSGLADKMKACD